MQALCGKAAALTLRAPAAKAAPPAARLSARRCGAFSAGSLALQRSPQPQRAVVVSRVVEANRGNQGGKLKTRKSAAKRYKVTASGKVSRPLPKRDFVPCGVGGSAGVGQAPCHGWRA